MWCDFISSSDTKIQWEYIQGLFETAVYGGRIDVSFDLRVLSSYLREFFEGKVVSGNAKKLLDGKLSVPMSVDYKVYFFDIVKLCLISMVSFVFFKILIFVFTILFVNNIFF